MLITSLQAQFADIVCLNRYHAWYSDVGEIEIVEQAVKAESYNWMNTYKKPFIFTEYGADTIAGLHAVRNGFISLNSCVI